jgi:hypothetical protein
MAAWLTEDVRSLEPGGVAQPLQEPEPDVEDDTAVGVA